MGKVPGGGEENVVSILYIQAPVEGRTQSTGGFVVPAGDKNNGPHIVRGTKK
jgi:hypothetical protein